MEVKDLLAKSTQNENTCKGISNIMDDQAVCGVDSSESFHTADNNTDKIKHESKEIARDSLLPRGTPDEQSDLERYMTAQDHMEDSETSSSLPKKSCQVQSKIKAEPPDPRRERVRRSQRVKSRDSSVESREKKHAACSRYYPEEIQSYQRTQPVVAENANYANPTYEYSEREDGWVTSLGQTYITHHQEHLGQNPVYTAGERPVTNHQNHPSSTSMICGGPSGQHRTRTESITRSNSSRSPASPRSQNSSKSNTPRYLDSDLAMRGHRSPLPVGFCKSSTPCKSQGNDIPHGHRSKASLPAGATASSSKADTPHKLPSHNTSMQSEGIVCRICHDGDSSEVLISPCYCAGSMGLLHVSCLQKWLGSSNKTSCEICNFEFALQKKTMPISQFLREPGTARDKRNLICDLVCFMMISPLTIIVVWICIHGAIKYYSNSQMEKSGLIGLAVSLILLYAVWVTVAIRQNWRLWNDWKMFHQEVTLVCTPSPSKKSPNIHAGCAESRSIGSVHLQSIKVSVQGPINRYRNRQKSEKKQKGDTKQDQGTSEPVSDGPDRRKGRVGKRESVSGNAYVNTLNNENDFHFHQEEKENALSHSRKGKSMRKYTVNEENQYFNCTDTKEDKGQPTNYDKNLPFTRSKLGQTDKRSYRSCERSSENSSNITEDNQRSQQFKSKLSKLEHLHGLNEHVFSKDDGASRLHSPVNTSADHRAGGFAKPNNPYIKYSPKDTTKVAGTQHLVGHKSLVHSGSSEENRSQGSLKDFVTKWVDDQTKVLVKQNQQMQSRGLSDFHKAHTPGTGVTYQHGHYSKRETEPGVNNKQCVETSENHTKIRRPATLSFTSSEVSFEQVLRDNNLAPSSHLADQDEKPILPMV